MPQANPGLWYATPLGLAGVAEFIGAVLGDPERCSGLVYGVPLGHGAKVNGCDERAAVFFWGDVGAVRRGRGKGGTVLFRG